MFTLITDHSTTREHVLCTCLVDAHSGSSAEISPFAHRLLPSVRCVSTSCTSFCFCQSCDCRKLGGVQWGEKSGFNGLATVGQIGLVIVGHGGQVDW